VQIDPSDLRRYYHGLSDDMLLAVDREELTEVALQVYDEELAHRNLSGQDFETDGEPDTDPDHNIEASDWLGEASCACTFAAGHAGDQAAGDAEHGRLVLEAAGIPCHVVAHAMDPAGDDPKPRYEYRLMVPGKLNMPAASVLDKEIFNAEVEAEWKFYFDSLSDEELRAVDSESLFAGLRDRMERAARAYQEVLATRGIQPN
jgi:hypothetical protein